MILVLQAAYAMKGKFSVYLLLPFKKRLILHQPCLYCSQIYNTKGSNQIWPFFRLLSSSIKIKPEDKQDSGIFKMCCCCNELSAVFFFVVVYHLLFLVDLVNPVGVKYIMDFLSSWKSLA